MNDVQQPDNQPHQIRGEHQPPRTGTRAITGFAVAGVILAFGIGAWSWSNSVTETTQTAGQVTASSSTTSDSSAGKTPSTAARSSSQQRSTGNTSPSRASQERGATSRNNSPKQSSNAGHDAVLDTPLAAPGLDLAPLAAGDPYLPPDSWGGAAQENLPSETVIAEAAPEPPISRTTTKPSNPILPETTTSQTQPTETATGEQPATTTDEPVDAHPVHTDISDVQPDADPANEPSATTSNSAPTGDRPKSANGNAQNRETQNAPGASQQPSILGDGLTQLIEPLKQGN